MIKLLSKSLMNLITLSTIVAISGCSQEDSKRSSSSSSSPSALPYNNYQQPTISTNTYGPNPIIPTLPPPYRVDSPPIYSNEELNKECNSFSSIKVHASNLEKELNEVSTQLRGIADNYISSATHERVKNANEQFQIRSNAIALINVDVGHYKNEIKGKNGSLDTLLTMSDKHCDSIKTYNTRSKQEYILENNKKIKSATITISQGIEEIMKKVRAFHNEEDKNKIKEITNNLEGKGSELVESVKILKISK